MKNRRKQKNGENQKPEEVYQQLRVKTKGKKKKGAQKMKQALKSITPYYDEEDIEFDLDDDSLLV